MRRLATIICTATVAVAALAGCGSDDGDDDKADASGGGDYCSQVKDMQDDYSDLQSTEATLDQVGDLSERMDGIADVAPSDVQKPWQHNADALSSMTQALDDAGIDGETPLSEAMQDKKAQQALMSADVDTASLTKDSKTIATQVKDECDIDITSDSSQ